jgi:hypothetical protein
LAAATLGAEGTAEKSVVGAVSAFATSFLICEAAAAAATLREIPATIPSMNDEYPLGFGGLASWAVDTDAAAAGLLLAEAAIAKMSCRCAIGRQSVYTRMCKQLTKG